MSRLVRTGDPPEDFISRLYKACDRASRSARNAPLSAHLRRHYLTSDLAEKLDLDDLYVGEGRVGIMWFDLLTGEGGDPARVEIVSHTTAKVEGPDTRLIEVSLYRAPDADMDVDGPYLMDFVLVTTLQGWRIDDIASTTGKWSLRTRLFWNEIIAHSPKPEG